MALLKHEGYSVEIRLTPFRSQLIMSLSTHVHREDRKKHFLLFNYLLSL